jgi:hypothetical protein
LASIGPIGNVVGAVGRAKISSNVIEQLADISGCYQLIETLLAALLVVISSTADQSQQQY